MASFPGGVRGGRRKQAKPQKKGNVDTGQSRLEEPRKNEMTARHVNNKLSNMWLLRRHLYGGGGVVLATGDRSWGLK